MKILNLFPKRIISGRSDAEPYMVRYTLLNLFVAGVYLHQILRSDDCDDYHDHPWPFFHLILKNGYFESGIDETPRFRFPGYCAFRLASYLHRVDVLIDKPSWSLVITGPRVREWGFVQRASREWIHWRVYLGQKTVWLPGCKLIQMDPQPPAGVNIILMSNLVHPDGSKMLWQAMTEGMGDDTQFFRCPGELPQQVIKLGQCWYWVIQFGGAQ